MQNVQLLKCFLGKLMQEYYVDSLSSIMFEKMIDYYNLNKDEVIRSLEGLYSDIVSSKINIRFGKRFIYEIS